jgi:hypothetical protein
VVASLLLFYAIRKNQIPWYEQDLVVERGRGQLGAG